jgi:RNA polymerase sigma-70 factor, ECF subfamily
VRRRGARGPELEALYREHYPQFVRVATGITGDRELARDAVQEAFASLWRNRRSFRGDGPLEAWVWRAVVNAARMQARAVVPEPVATLEDTASNGAPEADLMVDAWLAGLPDRQRTAVFLRYYADLDYRRIAEILGVEVGTVSATLSAAHSSLRRSLAKDPR